jgi:hypothetical protein
MFSPEVRVRDINPDFGNGCIELNNNTTADDLEKSIHDCFGLHVEISPRTEHQTTALQKLMPERTHITYFKNVPFGC